MNNVTSNLLDIKNLKVDLEQIPGNLKNDVPKNNFYPPNFSKKIKLITMNANASTASHRFNLLNESF